MKSTKQLNKFDIVVLFILAMIFVMVSPIFKSNSTYQTTAQNQRSKAVTAKVTKTTEVIEESPIKGRVPSLNECRRILNKNGEQYSDEEVKLIVNVIDNWARINAKTILETAKRS